MLVTIFVDDQKLFLNPFMTTLAGNVLLAIARSLKAPDGKQHEFLLNGDELQLQVDGQPVDLNLGRAKRIIGNLLRGLLVSLHGTETGKEFRFICQNEEQ
jgi:hypothetical protein